MKLKPGMYEMRPDWSVKGLMEMIRFLQERLGELKEKSLIEIGSYAGESTIIFAEHFGHVTSIDPYDVKQYKESKSDVVRRTPLDEVEKLFIENCSKYQNIRKIKLSSDDAAVQLTNHSVDVVYIDGLHTFRQVSRDILNYLPKIKTGGFITGHDYTWCREVKKAVDQHLGKPQATFCDSSWVIQVNRNI